MCLQVIRTKSNARTYIGTFEFKKSVSDTRRNNVCTRTRLSSRAVSQISSHSILYYYFIYFLIATTTPTAYDPPNRIDFTIIYIPYVSRWYRRIIHIYVYIDYITSRRTTCTRRNRVCVRTSCYWFYRPNTCIGGTQEGITLIQSRTLLPYFTIWRTVVVGTYI